LDAADFSPTNRPSTLEKGSWIVIVNTREANTHLLRVGKTIIFMFAEKKKLMLIKCEIDQHQHT